MTSSYAHYIVVVVDYVVFVDVVDADVIDVVVVDVDVVVVFVVDDVAAAVVVVVVSVIDSKDIFLLLIASSGLYLVVGKKVKAIHSITFNVISCLRIVITFQRSTNQSFITEFVLPYK
jgi:hypothetical protein